MPRRDPIFWLLTMMGTVLYAALLLCLVARSASTFAFDLTNTGFLWVKQSRGDRANVTTPV